MGLGQVRSAKYRSSAGRGGVGLESKHIFPILLHHFLPVHLGHLCVICCLLTQDTLNRT